MLFRRCLHFIEKENLFQRNQRILVAVSGGIDSMVLLYLLHKMEMECAVAHCNFGLRGEASDGDCELVEAMTKHYNFPCYTRKFDTEAHAKKHKISIEMAARDLRYTWFNELCDQHGFDYLAVGHHADDVAETVLINLIRGTGINGLTGIKPKNGNVVRPLLPFTRQELMDFAAANNIEFREDATNASTDFVRNKIRHQVMSVLEQINPGIRNTMTENVQRFTDVATIYNEVINYKKSLLLSEKDGNLEINIAKLQQVSAPASHLYELLAPFGFHFRDITNIVNALGGISGKRFYAATHQLLMDREVLIVSERKQAEHMEYTISKNQKKIDIPFKATLQQFEKPVNFQFSKQNNMAYFDADLLTFPLTIRKWQQGDYFQPIGMKGKKKVSDFFIDNKFSLQQKEKTWLLVSGNKIIWIIGHRIDERLKITNNTKHIYQISID